jgi:signal transduction histidine kinase
VKPYSITRRLISTILLVELLAALAISSAAMLYERHARFHAFDIMLRGRADSLLGAVVDAEDVGDNVMLDGTEANLPLEDIYQVRDSGGRILGRSANWTKHGEKQYRMIHLEGVRVVDPGEKGGGYRRHFFIDYGSSINPVWRAIWKTVGFYAATSLGLLAISGCLIFWMLDRGLAPLRKLAREAANISADSWKFSPPESARKIRELAPLTNALDTALTGLERSFVAQRHFVSDAAHELKTAVSVMKSSLQLLTLKHRTALEYERGLALCQQDCERIEDTVARMLTLARLETRDTAAGAPTSLVETLRRSGGQFASMAELRQVQIRYTGSDDALIEIEPQQLEVLCGNLLLNALQHSPAGSTIHASVRTDSDEAELVIEDDGDGIAPEDLPHVFERFYRGDPSRSRKTGGTGLGLAIAKAIASQWQGSIAIASEPGYGTRVTVSFPRIPEPSVLVKVGVRN